MALKFNFGQEISALYAPAFTKMKNCSRQFPVKLDKALLIFTPLMAGSTLFASPSLAASFASSEASAFLSDFNQIAESSSVSVDASVFAETVGLDDDSAFDMTSEDTIVDSIEVNPSSEDDSALAFADFDALAFFPDDGGSSLISNDHVNEAFGTGANFSAQSETDTTAIASFSINPAEGTSEIFSFEFVLSLLLETTVSDETAAASGDIAIEICGSESSGADLLFCDSLSISGLFQNTGDNAFSVQSSDAFSFEEFGPVEETSFNSDLQQDTQELDFFAIGSYQREFTTPIVLTLNETKVTTAKVSETIVETPEPSSLVGIMLGAGLMIGQVGRRKATKELAHSNEG